MSRRTFKAPTEEGRALLEAATSHKQKNEKRGEDMTQRVIDPRAPKKVELPAYLLDAQYNMKIALKASNKALLRIAAKSYKSARRRYELELIQP